MASASRVICFHCQKSSSGSLRNGWDLSTGKFAQLCGRCYKIYKSGLFCETFHKRQDDWQKCQFCSKPIHCSCLVSFNKWLLLVDGGGKKVICMECSKITSFMEQHFSNELDLDEELRRFEISRCTEAYIVSMFEKPLHAGDISNSEGSIVIQNQHAEAYFPEVSDPHGIPISAVDKTDTKELNLRLRFCFNKMYVLDDLREYMVSHKLQAGDTLTFSRMVPDGAYFIGFRKASSRKPSGKASTRNRK